MLRSADYSRPVRVNHIMRRVLLALLPGIAAYVWYFGPAILISLTLASLSALAVEAAMLKLRARPLRPYLSDHSALLTAWLLALSIPPLAPWWLVVTGTAFAIAVAKHLYGGLGHNPFNPAMIGYAVLIVSFPSYMTHWPPPQDLSQVSLSLAEQFRYMLTSILPPALTLDAITMATPLDTLKTHLHLDQSVQEIMNLPIFGHLAGHGSEVVAAGYLLGGLYLIRARLISWHVPTAYLATLFTLAGLFHLAAPQHYAPPLFHLFSGAAMLGAFFILTDPVTSPTTPRGKLLFAALAAGLTFVIRAFGGFPDAVAFSTLLMNLCVPLIDAWTQPRIYGSRDKDSP